MSAARKAGGPSLRAKPSFAAIKALAQANILELVQLWLPDGELKGREWVALNPKRTDRTRKSFSINIDTGAWADFALLDDPAAKGRDIIRLAEYLFDLSSAAAAQKVETDLAGLSGNGNGPKPKAKLKAKRPARPQAAWTGVDPPLSEFRHFQLGLPVAVWFYRDAAGAIVAAAARYDVPTPKGEKQQKEFRPWRYVQTSNPYGGTGTNWDCSAPDPCTLYNLDKLAPGPVIICEGEKKADAAMRLFPGMVAVSSMQGAGMAKRTDWSPLKGRDWIIWPDHDPAGTSFVDAVGLCGKGVGADAIKVVQVPPDWPLKWDLADKPPKGVNTKMLRAMLDAAEEWKDQLRVPEDAGTFAGMTLDEVCADICQVSAGGWWWSHRHALPFKAAELNNALSSLHWLIMRGRKKPLTTFLSWYQRNRVVKNYKCFVRRGGQPPVCETALGAGDAAVNRWRPLPPVPEEVLDRVRREGDAVVQPWLEIASDLCNGDKKQVEQLLDWAAQISNDPGHKPGWSTVLYSAPQGIGKDTWVDGLIRTLPPGEGTTIGRKDLEGNFNAYLVLRLVHVSDLQQTTRGTMNGVDTYNSLKQVASNLPRTIRVNEKFQPKYDADNLCGWVLSTNDEAPMAIPPEDRRWYVTEGRDTLREDKFYADVRAWLDRPETGMLIRAYLQLRWESMSAERRAVLQGHAPETEAKRRMIDAGMTPVMAAIKEMLEDNGIFPDLVRADDIIERLRMLQGNDRLPRFAPLPSRTQLGIWMKTKFGATQVPDKKGADGRPITARMADGSNARIWAIRASRGIYAGLATVEVGKRYATLWTAKSHATKEKTYVEVQRRLRKF